MGRFIKRMFLAVAILFLVFIVLPVAAGVGVVALAYTSGTVYVEVEEGNTDLSIPLPGGLLPMALRFMPRGVCHDLATEVGPSWGAVTAAVDEMDRIPDSVLVAVDSGKNQVRVVKEGGRIVVRVESGDGRVMVSVPLRMVSSVVHQIERACF